MSEDQHIEYKESWRDEYLKWICGFANAQGGVLEIGKDDGGAVVGVADPANLLEVLPNKIRDVLGIVPDVHRIEQDGNEFPFAAAYVESVPESQPESLEIRVLRLLQAGPLAKSELSEGLGQKEVSGQLNKVVRALLERGAIEYTIPNKPRSRLQKYRLTARGEDALADNSVGRELL